MEEEKSAQPEALPEDFQPQMSFDGLERTVCDYIAGMTDKYAVDDVVERRRGHCDNRGDGITCQQLTY